VAGTLLDDTDIKQLGFSHDFSTAQLRRNGGVEEEGESRTVANLVAGASICSSHERLVSYNDSFGEMLRSFVALCRHLASVRP